MKTKLLPFITLVAALCLPVRAADPAPAAAAADLGALGLQGKFVQALVDLKATPEQRAQIATILKGYRPEAQPLVDKAIAARKAVAGKLHAEPYDEAAVRQAVRDAAAVAEDLAVLHGRVIQDVRAVLTPDQREVLKKLRGDVTGELEGRVGLVRKLVNLWIDNHAN